MATSRLVAPRARIAACHLPRRSGDTLMIATWNIRALGAGRRRPESLLCTAEVLSYFDLVSIVGLRENLDDFDAILQHLGPLGTSTTLGTEPRTTTCRYPSNQKDERRLVKRYEAWIGT